MIGFSKTVAIIIFIRTYLHVDKMRQDKVT